MTAAPEQQVNPDELRSFATRLRDELETIAEDFDSLLSRSTIRNTDRNRGGPPGVFFAGYANWGWVPDDDVGERTRLLERVEDWASRFQLLHRSAIDTTQRRIDEHLQLLRAWLQRDGGDHSVPSTIEKARAKARSTFDALQSLIDIGTHGDACVLIVPDTNVLLTDPDVAHLSASTGLERFTAVMLPPVVAELDELKDRGRTPDVREKASAALRRLKGLRDRGDIRTRVPVEGQVSLRMEHREVRSREVLDWLDPDIPDDRILAGTLDLQARFPSAIVVLATRDLNLQTKAAAADMPFIDPSA